ncbi:MAG: VWA domain-containing protein [Polyangiaceae bacterium]
MNQSRSVIRSVSVAALVGAFAACSTSPSPGDRDTSQGGAAGSSAGGSSSSASGGGVSFGFGGATGSSGDTSTAGATCAATSVTAKLIPLDLYVMMDSSKSMNEPTSAGSTKWKATTDALKAFFADTNSAGLGIGLKFFPDEQAVPAVCTSTADCGNFGPCDQRKACVAKDTYTKVISSGTLCDDQTPCANANEVCAVVERCADGANCAKVYCVSGGTSAPCPADLKCVPFTGYCRERDVCTAANYATPAVAWGNLPDAANALNSAIAARMPDGYTPTGPALTGALQQARDRAKANPGRKVAVILVTDGLPGGFIPNKPPTSCMPGDIAGVAGVLTAGNMATADAPAIQTFVIGVFGPCDVVDQNVMPQANLDTLAKAGGTNAAVIIRTDQDVQQQLQNALKQARSSAIACQYEIPASSTGSVDYGKVNVKFSSSANSSTLLYVTSKDKCDPSKGGWYYDHDPLKPEQGKPTQIIVCDQSCTQFQMIQDGRVDIALGCKTEVPL